MWWLAALIGGVLGIAGKITGRARRKQAMEHAIQEGGEELRSGQALTAQNASQLAQDNLYVLSLSGVSATEGTASQLSQQTKLQSTATINKMSKDFDNYVYNLRANDDADAANTAFSIAGDVFSTVGRLSYDNVRLNQQAYTSAPPPILESPEFLTPYGQERLNTSTSTRPATQMGAKAT